MALVKRWKGKRDYFWISVSQWDNMVSYSKASYQEAKKDIAAGNFFFSKEEALGAREMVIKRLRAYQRKLNKSVRIIDKLKS